MARSCGMNRLSTEYSLLAVPRSPSVCQISWNVALDAADRVRLQHGDEPAIDQGLDDRPGEFADCVVFVRGRGDHGHEIARFLDLRMDGRHAVCFSPYLSS